MSLWLTGLSVPSVHVQWLVLGGASDPQLVLEGGARVQSDTGVGRGRSLL